MKTAAAPSAPFVVGAVGVYKATVLNLGTAATTGTTTVSFGGAFDSAAGTGWTCDNLGSCSRTAPIAAGGAAPTRTGEAAMYLAGTWYAIDLSGGSSADSSRASGLDVARLQDQVLAPLLKIGDVRTDKRIDFIGGARGAAALEKAVDSGQAAVAFSMYPVAIDDLIAISDEGGIMPPKSTWFEPKLRDGLLIHTI